VAYLNQFDVLIVGAGPAGISTWLHLKKYAPALAEHTVLIEKAVFPRDKLCAGGVGAWSAAVLDQLAIDLSIPSLFISEVEIRYRDQRWIYHSPDPFRMVKRAEFDMALAESALQRGMVFHENEVFIGAKREGDKLAVLTSRGQYHVKAIVGADGALSKVRRSMMRPRRSCLAPTIQISTPANPTYDREFGQRRLGIDFSPIDNGLQGYAWHCPWLEGKNPYMNHGIGNFRFHRGTQRVILKELFQRELHDRNIDIKPGDWSSHPIRWYSNDVPISQPNVLLVGDAAGIEPAFGGGVHMALSYGEIAAETLMQAFQDKDFSFRHYKDSIMSHYLGGHIRICTHLASRLYGGKEDPLTLVRQFFTGRFGKRDLLSILLRPKSA
jgi:flavin-dependent dehydrogenase